MYMSGTACGWHPHRMLLLIILVCTAWTASNTQIEYVEDLENDSSWCDNNATDYAVHLLQVQQDVERAKRLVAGHLNEGTDGELMNSGTDLKPMSTQDVDNLISAISLDSAYTSASFPIWVPIVVLGIPSLIFLGFVFDYLTGQDHFRKWLKEVSLADLPQDRRCSYYLFGLAFAIALATLQFVGPLRTAMFFKVVGTDKEPIAKSLVLVVLLPIVMLYSIAVTLLPSTRALVVVVNGFYTLVFLLLTMMIASSAGEIPAWVAWALYFAVETKGVILMPMIWSVVADVSTAELSKKAYPFLFFVMQVGGIGGSFIAIHINRLGGPVGLLLIQTCTMALMAMLTWGAVSVIEGNPDAEYPQEALPKKAQDSDGSESLTSVALKRIWEGGEGFWLLISRRYVLMTYFVSYATLVIRTMLDYENGVLIKRNYPNATDQVAYMGRMTLVQNIAIATIALLGTRQILELLNVAKVLLILPIVSLICIAALCVDHQLLTSTVAAVVSSTVAYALNSPCKEILFVRTSRDIKYKAKSWSEMYGNNLMKILGAQVNLWVNNEKDSCLGACFHPVPTFILSGSWVVVWMSIALTVGWQFQELDAKDDIIS
mmetsp:Transcript_12812/g.22988  ORF Transcript_12812/g.22988 Transcript_12812/m.22988 type:complete len:601 (+) Transcript_12812:74-1876(+)